MTLQNLPRSECACPTCRRGCEFVPGWFLPNEIGPAARLSGLTVKQFFRRHLQIDYWCGETKAESIFVLRPAVIGGVPAKEAPFDSRGRCVFYGEDGMCAIHAAKPYECAVARPCLAPSPDGLHWAVGEAWATPQARALIRRLLGRKPKQPKCSFFEAMGMFLGVVLGHGSLDDAP